MPLHQKIWLAACAALLLGGVGAMARGLLRGSDPGGGDWSPAIGQSALWIAGGGLAVALAALAFFAFGFAARLSLAWSYAPALAGAWCFVYAARKRAGWVGFGFATLATVCAFCVYFAAVAVAAPPAEWRGVEPLGKPAYPGAKTVRESGMERALLEAATERRRRELTLPPVPFPKGWMPATEDQFRAVHENPALWMAWQRAIEWDHFVSSLDAERKGGGE